MYIYIQICELPILRNVKCLLNFPYSKMHLGIFPRSLSCIQARFFFVSGSEKLLFYQELERDKFLWCEQITWECNRIFVDLILNHSPSTHPLSTDSCIAMANQLSPSMILSHFLHCKTYYGITDNLSDVLLLSLTITLQMFS